MRDRRDLSSRQKASLARNSDISVDPYDRGAYDLARTASHDRHLRFIVANIRAAWRNFNYQMSGAQTSAHRVLKRKFIAEFPALLWTLPCEFCVPSMSRDTEFSAPLCVKFCGAPYSILIFAFSPKFYCQSKTAEIL